jgi:hypothetical protein
MWLNLAVAQGNEMAKTASDAMEKDMTLPKSAKPNASAEWKPTTTR